MICVYIPIRWGRQGGVLLISSSPLFEVEKFRAARNGQRWVMRGAQVIFSPIHNKTAWLNFRNFKAMIDNT